MGNECQGSNEQKKVSSEAKSSPAKGKQSTKRVSGYRSRARNALYTLAAEYKRRHPKATARDAWNNLCAVAGLGVHDVLIAHDPDAGTLTYRPDPVKFVTREIRKATFYRGFQRMADS